MSYWQYRAINAQLEVTEGVVAGEGDSDQDCAGILLKLRHQGLQVLRLDKIDRLAYQRELGVQKLRARLNRQPGLNHVSKHEASPSIQGKPPGLLTRLLARFL